MAGFQAGADGLCSISADLTVLNVNSVDDAGAGTAQLARLRYQGNLVGTITVSAGGAAYNTTSDRRVKDVLGPLETDPFDIIGQLGVYYVRYLAQSPEVEPRLSLISQEVEAVAPWAVTGAPDGTETDPKTKEEVIVAQQLDATALIPAMIAADKHNRARIDALETALNEAFRRISALEGAA